MAQGKNQGGQQGSQYDPTQQSSKAMTSQFIVKPGTHLSAKKPTELPPGSWVNRRGTLFEARPNGSLEIVQDEVEEYVLVGGPGISYRQMREEARQHGITPNF